LLNVKDLWILKFWQLDGNKASVLGYIISLTSITKAKLKIVIAENINHDLGCIAIIFYRLIDTILYFDKYMNKTQMKSDDKLNIVAIG
jgi:hypothetical protein